MFGDYSDGSLVQSIPPHLPESPDQLAYFHALLSGTHGLEFALDTRRQCIGMTLQRGRMSGGLGGIDVLVERRAVTRSGDRPIAPDT
jgi:hypothetical protein